MLMVKRQSHHDKCFTVNSLAFLGIITLESESELEIMRLDEESRGNDFDPLTVVQNE